MVNKVIPSFPAYRTSKRFDDSSTRDHWARPGGTAVKMMDSAGEPEGPEGFGRRFLLQAAGFLSQSFLVQVALRCSL